jgi:plasmid replication initiation protein
MKTPVKTPVKIAHLTKKQKKVIMLPAIKDYIYQPNRVTNAIYEYSLTQEKVFNAVMYYLQDAIKISRKGEDYTQLALFKEFNNAQFIKFNIPLKELSIPQNYEHVKKAVKKLASIVIEFPHQDAVTKEKYVRYAGLLSANVPVENNRSSHIEVEIDKRIAKLLIDIEQNQYGQPINYTRFLYSIAQSAKNKYTPRVYKLICSWRKKGGFTISLDTFREQMGLDSKYKYYNDIKKHILVPVQEELFEKADCWFNCNSEDFITKQGNTVTHLNFKVITPELIKEDSDKKDYVFHLLRTHFKFEDKQIAQIEPIFSVASTTEILQKIMQLSEFISKDATKITDITGYIMKSLLNEFENPLKF